MKKEKINLRKKRVTVMGIGLHGGAVDLILWLLDQGAKVIATDKKSKTQLADSIEKLENLKNLSLVVGQHRMEDFEGVDLVMKNPAVPWGNKYIQAALKKKVSVEMDSSLFFEQCLSKNVIGVTGTKGKTTTSNLIAKILDESGGKAIRVGIGQRPVMSKLEKIKKNSWVVFELSSWRLSALSRKKISPRFSVVTNIFPDHLNYYGSMEKYLEDKKAIVANQKLGDFCVLNYDDLQVKDFSKETKAQVVYFSKNKIDENMCVYVEDDNICFNWDGRIGKVCSIDQIGLIGSHNLQNVLAAVSVAMAAGASTEAIGNAIKNFKGVRHRLELVGQNGNVKFINDTTATTPESAIAGIDSFSEKIDLICGGSNKNLDLKPLAEKIAKTERVERVFLLKGAATEELKKNIEKSEGGDKLVDVYDNMKEVVAAAYRFANENSEEKIILLSPGCASFGMFDNEFERGEQFREAVKLITNNL